MRKLMIGILCLPLGVYNMSKPSIDVINTKILVKKSNVLHVKASFYNPELNQTDSFPLETASGRIIDTNKLRQGKLKWVALSRSLLRRFGGHFRYGDSITIKNAGVLNGKYMVVDCMGPQYKYKVDILVHRKFNSKLRLKNKIHISW